MATVADVTTRFGGDIAPLMNSVNQANAVLTGFARNAASSLGVAFSGAAAVGFIKNVIDVNGQLQDLADQTKFSASTLSGLRPTLENAGLSAETFARTIQFAQKTLGGTTEESGKAAEAFKAMGLSIDELKSLSPEEFLLRTAKGIAEFGDQNSRAALLTATMGRGASQLSGVIDKLAKDFGTLRTSGLNNETIAALDDIGDGLHSASIAAQNFAATNIVDTFTAFNNILQALGGTVRAFQSDAKPFIGVFDDLGKMANTTEMEFLAVHASMLKIMRAVPLMLEALSTPWKFDVGKMTFSTGAGLDFNSKAWTKAIDDVEKRLGAMKFGGRDLGPDAGGIGLPPPSSGGKTFNPVDSKAADAIKSVTEGLQKQLIALQAEEMALTKGAGAAMAWRLEHEAMAQAGIGKLTPKMEELIGKIVKGADAMDNFRVQQQALADGFAAMDMKTDAATRASEDFIAVLAKLRESGLSPIEKELTAINAEYDRMAAATVNFGEMTGQPVQQFLKQIEQSRGAALMKVDSPLGLTDQTLNRVSESLRAAEIQSKIFGDSFDLAGAKINIFRNALTAMGADLDLSNVQFQKMADDLKMLEEGQKAADVAEQLIRGGMAGVTNSLKGIAMGTQSAADAFKNMGVAAVTALGNVAIELLLIKPLIDGLNSSMNGSGGGSGGGGGGSGLFSMIGGFFDRWLGLTFDDGGVVPGPRGAPRMAMVHGGETILPTHRMGTPVAAGMGAGQARGGEGNVVYNIDARGAQRGVSDEIRRAIELSRKKAVQQSVGAVAEERGRSNACARGFSR